MSVEERLERIERLILIGAKNTLNVSEAATMLGISETRIRHLVCETDIPHYKRGGRVFFDKSELEDWQKGERIPTKQELLTDYELARL